MTANPSCEGIETPGVALVKVPKSLIFEAYSAALAGLSIGVRSIEDVDEQNEAAGYLGATSPFGRVVR
jgi:hypothetical protein